MITPKHFGSGECPIGDWKTIDSHNRIESLEPVPFHEVTGGEPIWSAAEHAEWVANRNKSRKDSPIYHQPEADILMRYTYSGADVFPALDIRVPVLQGMRTVLHGIPKGEKYDSFPYTAKTPLHQMQVQVYRNRHGYMVADKVFPGGVRRRTGSIVTDFFIAPAESADKDTSNTVDESRLFKAPPGLNVSKSEVTDRRDPTWRQVSLLGDTTLTMVTGDHTYTRGEMAVGTPNDDCLDADGVVDFRLPVDVVRYCKGDYRDLLKIFLVPDSQRPPLRDVAS